MTPQRVKGDRKKCLSVLADDMIRENVVAPLDVDARRVEMLLSLGSGEQPWDGHHRGGRSPSWVISRTTTQSQGQSDPVLAIVLFLVEQWIKTSRDPFPPTFL